MFEDVEVGDEVAWLTAHGSSVVIFRVRATTAHHFDAGSEYHAFGTMRFRKCDGVATSDPQVRVQVLGESLRARAEEELSWHLRTKIALALKALPLEVLKEIDGRISGGSRREA